MAQKKIKVLFVCLGNICRSPMAEGIFRKIIKDENLEEIFCVESAGTASYHIGELPDERMRSTASKHGIQLNSRARQIDIDDFYRFNYILVADDSNLQDVLRLASPPKECQIQLIRYYDDNGKDENVPDPYYGGIDGFDNVYDILHRSIFNFFNMVKKQHQILS